METLQIKNFGPIVSADIEIKDINIFIGKTSSGKSTVAKLAAIFQSAAFVLQADTKTFRKLLQDYNIDFAIRDVTYIKYTKGDMVYELKDGQFDDQNPLDKWQTELQSIIPYFQDVYDFEDPGVLLPLFVSRNLKPGGSKESDLSKSEIVRKINSILIELKEILNNVIRKTELSLREGSMRVYDLLLRLKKELRIYEPVYIPAERILLSMVAESLFGLLKNDVSIATCVKDFGAKFEMARKEVSKAEIDFLGVKYEYKDNFNYIILSNGTRIKLEHGSSGLQSVMPLYLVLKYISNKPSNRFDSCIVIEEPESNLYPTVQKDLIEFIVGTKLKTNDKLIITTHSPYVLTTIDNLIQAYNVAVREGKFRDEVEKIVPSGYWTDFDRVSCYYFENGVCRSTMDPELKIIGASNIDDVSIELGKEFDELIALKYK